MESLLKSTFLTIVFFYLSISAIICQVANDDRSKIINEDLNDKKEYLEKIDLWVHQQFSKGVTFPREELVEHLKTYKELTKESDDFVPYRINYYIMLANNAEYSNRNGECIYYLEKAEKEIYDFYGERPLMVAGRKINVYLENRNYKKVLKTYYDNLLYLSTFPKLIEQSNLNLNISMTYVSILNPSMEAFVALNDVRGANRVYELSESIHAALLKKLPQDNVSAQYVNFYQAHIRYQKSLTGSFQPEIAQKALDEMKIAVWNKIVQDKETNNDIQSKYYLSKAKYYYKIENKDSIYRYLDSLRGIPFLKEEQQYEANALTTLIAEKEGDFFTAYTKMKKVARSADSLRALLVDDIDNLVYSHTESEINRELLNIAQKKENIRRLWIIGLIGLFTTAALIAYYLFKKREAKSKKRIEELDREVNLQISIMEERLAYIRKEEQNKLAQDLHDSFASKIASIKQRLRILKDDEMTPEQNENIDVLIYISNELYNEARKQSHELNDEDNLISESIYIDNLLKIIKYALPKGEYETEINIDPGALEIATLEIRIQLIYIFQEILTNIIKHAKAKKIQLSIYKENNILNILIEDNGRGFNAQKQLNYGLGFKSITNRLEKINGTMAITSEVNRTSVFIEIVCT
ncbi:ATP-binding protein [uncultured Sphingobacterium sp.]|uniref:sensor histidine kinase n=1 Tax=uncultured Sphingobacterium sp. TaxID=182688 RepID=UPI0025E455D0|nr:ATP-binding protein [uncultured Sphingobacterium sp.]